MSKRGYKIISQTTIEKAVFKRDINEFVPFFILFQIINCPDNIDGCEVLHKQLKKSIQTSDEKIFREFLGPESGPESGSKPIFAPLDDDF